MDPGAAEFIRMLAENGLPPIQAGTPEAGRVGMRARKDVTQAPAPEGVASQDLAAPGPGGKVPIRLYRPEGATGALPVTLYLHGGGWVIGDLEVFDALCRRLCLASGAAVASVDYRLAPEHRFPAAIEDAQAALAFLRDEAAALGIDPGRIAVGGDSAGGNLATVLALHDRGATRPLAAQLLIYPATDMRADHPSVRENARGLMLEAETMEWFYGHYLGDDALRHDWRASPLLAEDLSGLPQALVLTAGFDPLRDEGRAYADALSAAGTAAQYVCFARQIHGFVSMTRITPEAETAIDLSGSFLRRAFGMT